VSYDVSHLCDACPPRQKGLLHLLNMTNLSSFNPQFGYPFLSLPISLRLPWSPMNPTLRVQHLPVHLITFELGYINCGFHYDISVCVCVCVYTPHSPPHHPFFFPFPFPTGDPSARLK
jgi:hypothetical protein